MPLSSRGARVALWIAPWALLPLFFAPGTILLSGASGHRDLMIRILGHYGVTFLPWIAFSRVVQLLAQATTRRLPIAKSAWVVHVVAWAILCVIHAALLVAAEILWLHVYDSVGTSATVIFPRALLNIAPTDAMTYAAVASAFIGWDLLRRYQERELRLTESRLNDLKAQLQPHFLFNALNAIAELVHVDADAADLAIGQLSRLLRRFADQRGHTHALGNEMALLFDYVGLQKVLLGSRLNFEQCVAPEAMRALVPTMVLQPLVENAIQHGVSTRRGPSHVRLSALLEGNNLRLQIVNEGSQAVVHQRDGTGLRNVRGRLAALYGADAQLDFSISVDGTARVEVTLPCRFEVAP